MIITLHPLLTATTWVSNINLQNVDFESDCKLVVNRFNAVNYWMFSKLRIRDRYSTKQNEPQSYLIFN